VIFGAIHGWAGTLWIAAVVWKKNRKGFSVLSGLFPIVARVYGPSGRRHRWAPVVMMVAGSVIIMLA